MKKTTVVLLFGLLFTKASIFAQHRICGIMTDGCLGEGKSDTRGGDRHWRCYTLPLDDERYTLTAVFIGVWMPYWLSTANFRLRENPMALEQVVVTGTRTPKLLKDVLILTRVISEREIRWTDATDIDDLLQAELPGVEFSYSMNRLVLPNISDFGDNSVLFLVNGEHLASEMLDNVDYSRLNMDNG